MDKTRLVITETFASQNEQERRQALQKAVDEYLALALTQEPTPEEAP